MSEDESLMRRLEAVTQRFQELKWSVTNGDLVSHDIEERLEKLNRDFAAYIEDWNILAEDVRKNFRCNYLGMQNDFHYVANVMLSHYKNIVPTNNDDPIDHSRDLENQSDQNRMQTVDVQTTQKSIELAAAAAKIRFGDFPDGNTAVSTTVTIGNDSPATVTATEAATNSSLVETWVNNKPMVSPIQSEPMIVDEAENAQTPKTAGVDRLVVIVKDNPSDRANTKPLEMPSSKKVMQDREVGEAMRSFASLSFEDKSAMFEPILKLPKVAENVDESALNNYLVALTEVKERFRNTNVLCDKQTEEWMLMIMLSTLDETSLRWWRLLMGSAQPAIEILTDFLTTRVENFKHENKAFKCPPKRASPPELPGSTEKKVRSRSTSRSRPTGTKPKVIVNRPLSPSGPRQPDCRYCRRVGHVVANCPVFAKDTPENREGNLFHKNLCIVCLLPHQKGECKKANVLCPVCKRAHHPFLQHRH